MSTKIRALFILIIGLWTVTAKIQKSPDNTFKVHVSASFNVTSTQEAIDDAEQAQNLYGKDLTKIADHMKEKLRSRHDFRELWSCIANFGKIRSSISTRGPYIYLKSNGDDDKMHIFCFKSILSEINYNIKT